MFRILKVTGESLSPFLMPGDYVLVGRLPHRQFPIKVGDIVVVRHSYHGTLIKRVESIASGGELFVVGDHPESIDSRTFGPVRFDRVVGKVLLTFRKKRQDGDDR